MSVLNWPDDKQKKLMEQYEHVRSAGFCNMFNMDSVKSVADKLKFKELSEAASNREVYKTLLTNFNKLMKKHNIKQD